MPYLQNVDLIDLDKTDVRRKPKAKEIAKARKKGKTKKRKKK